jgi:large subunit ribosomal protein L18
MRTSVKAVARTLRRARVRKRVRGTSDRPRLSIFRSEKHMYAQIVVDDARSQTLIAVSTRSPELREQLKKTWGVEAAKQVGLLTARRCKEKGITRVVFDRDGFLYHGRVRAVAEGAREGGLEF